MEDLNLFQTATIYLGSGAGIWFVFRLVRWFQNDFVEVGRKALEAERKAKETEERIADNERRLRIRAQLRIAVLERLLTMNGIQIPPEEPDDIQPPTINEGEQP